MNLSDKIRLLILLESMMIYLALPEVKIRLTDTSICHFDADFCSLGWCDINILKLHTLVWCIAHSGYITQTKTMNDNSTNSNLQMIHHYTKKNLDSDNVPNTQHKFENKIMANIKD